ncbi:hypothetical protein B0H17DRAFT_506734 [Mycena rosella]|uniref:Uncharacterized protein n=1 Tax=Mycena rosella TaxID=1033263 RepID=A0AAD7DLW2_MYCRO|nr:hypothetical protein B0H17DRAFT_506734 [Mycena rosella]
MHSRLLGRIGTSVLVLPYACPLCIHHFPKSSENSSTQSRSRSTKAELEVEVENNVPLWRTIVFVFIGLLECLAWLGYGSFLLITGHPRWDGIQRFLVASTWLYTTARPVARPTATPPFDLLAIYLAHIGGGILQLGGYLFQHNASGAPLPGTWVLVGLSVNLAASVGLVVVIMGMPLALPSHLVKKEDIGLSVSPEDYTSLWGWVSFAWVYSLVKRGRNTTLNEKDVWNLSPNMQSRPIFIKFSSLPQKSLLASLWAANSFDILMDFLLTLCSIMFNYAAPFFLKRILDEVDTSHESERTRARPTFTLF